jgi:hypothetical protein
MRLWNSEKGTSLIETAIALGVLSVGALGVAAVFTRGMELTKSSPGDLTATQKAQEAIESLFAARDSDTVTWAQLRNVTGADSDGGIILDGPQSLKEAGPDGIVNTADDGDIETILYPGPDLLVGNSDDRLETLAGFTRDIQIRDITATLRTITVTIAYQSGEIRRTYLLTAYISDYN